MLRALIVVVVAAGLSGVAAFAAISVGGPSTAELDRDMAAVKAEIADAEGDLARFSGGLVLAQARLRTEILKSTYEMLEQKRTSMLRGLTLSYTDPMPRTAASSDTSAIEAELVHAKAEALQAAQEASRYSGGLLQSVSFMREVTAKATVASVEQRIALIKMGIPLLQGGSATGPSAPLKTAATTPGKTTTDTDALK